QPAGHLHRGTAAAGAARGAHHGPGVPADPEPEPAVTLVDHVPGAAGARYGPARKTPGAPGLYDHFPDRHPLPPQPPGPGRLAGRLSPPGAPTGRSAAVCAVRRTRAAGQSPGKGQSTGFPPPAVSGNSARPPDAGP